MYRTCRCGPDLRSRSPRATARRISPNGIRSIERPSIGRSAQFPRPGPKRRRKSSPGFASAIGRRSDRLASLLIALLLSRWSPAMKDVFAKLLTDFLSTIVFLAIYLTTGNVVLATSAAIAGAVAQVIYSRVKRQPLAFMTYASVALVIVLGSVTLLTNDPRF